MTPSIRSKPCMTRSSQTPPGRPDTPAGSLAFSRLLGRLSVAAAPGRLDDEHVAGLDVHRVAAVHRRHPAVGVLDPVAAEGARLAAGQAEGRDAAVAGERGNGHRLVEAEPADAAVAAAPAAGPA